MTNQNDPNSSATEPIEKFAFGRNWSQFVQTVDQESIELRSFAAGFTWPGIPRVATFS